MGEVIAATGDRTGSWTGYGEVDVDYYITSDLQGGRLPKVIDAGDPAVMISHWQGFYGIHNEIGVAFGHFRPLCGGSKNAIPMGRNLSGANAVKLPIMP